MQNWLETTYARLVILLESDFMNVQAVKNSSVISGYSHYILNTGHPFDSFENTLEILNIQQKGLRTLEKI